jgi:hypothetical protein
VCAQTKSVASKCDGFTKLIFIVRSPAKIAYCVVVQVFLGTLAITHVKEYSEIVCKVFYVHSGKGR